MGRRSIFDKARLMESALSVVAEGGVGGATIAAISEKSGAPVGSIYYRYASRELLLADLWLTVAEEFQAGLIEELRKEPAREAGVGAALYFCGWVRKNPREARLLLLHRREDFFQSGWPEEYVGRAARLKSELASGARGLAKRIYGAAGGEEMARVNFALFDIAYGPVKRYVEAGKAPPPEVDELIRIAVEAVIGCRV